MIRLVLRRDRLLLPVWILVAVLVPLGVASGAARLYKTAEQLRAYADEAMNNPAEVFMRGMVYAPTLGGVTAWGAGISGALIAALASVLVVIRHTRAEEETGRRELLGSTAISRQAGLTATLVVVSCANLLAGVLLGARLAGLGLPAPGSFLLGLSMAGIGMVAGAVAAVTAQLTAGSGAARGLALTVLGVLFLLRAAGDSSANRPTGALAGATAGARGAVVGAVAGSNAAVQGVDDSVLSWVSPFGWVRLGRAFVGDRWWVLALFVLLAATLSLLAYRLSASRDLAAGLLPARSGPRVAAPGLRTQFALAWREHRASLLAWTAGAAVVGLLLGGAAKGAQGQLEGLFSGSDALFTFSLLVLSQAVSGYAIATALRPRAEERDGLAELLLATAPDRTRWAGAHLRFAALGPVIMLAAAGLTMSLSYGVSTGDLRLAATLESALLWLPAIWVMTGLAVALLGLLPRAAGWAAWALLGAFLLVELAHEFGQVNDAVLELSPFSHIPRTLLGAPLSPGPLVGLLAVAALLAVGGLVGLHRRDLG